MIIIYKTTNKVNNKIYIGKHTITSNNDNYLGSGIALKNAIELYGKENFIRETLEIVNENNWIEREKFWIKKLKSTDDDIGYNIHPGGNSGPILSGDKNGMFGKKHTEEVKKKAAKEPTISVMADQYMVKEKFYVLKPVPI